MNFFSLGISLGIQIYSKLEDQDSQKNFSLVCRDFRTLKITGDHLYPIYRYVFENYQLIKDSSSVSDLNITNFNPRVIFLSECHISAHHRKINSQLINMLWNNGVTELYSETGDDSQVPHVQDVIKSQIKCWDIDKNFYNLSTYLMNASCSIGKMYVECFVDNKHKFKEFLESYQYEKTLLYNLTKNQNINDFYSTETVESICDKIKIEDNEDIKKKSLVELTNYLLKETIKISKYSNEIRESYTAMRNQSLFIHVVRSLANNKCPIVVAGHAHTISDEVQSLSKFNKIGIVALMPLNKSKVVSSSTSGEADVNNYIYNTIDKATDFWHEVTTILRFINERDPSEAELAAYVLSNEHLFQPLKHKIKSYEFGENMELWNAFPGFIYMSELFRLSK